MTYQPNFNRLEDGIRSTQVMADFGTKDNIEVGNQAIFGSVQGISRPECPSDDHNDAYRSSADMEHEILCHQNKRRAIMADAEFRTELNSMYDDASIRHVRHTT